MACENIQRMRADMGGTNILSPLKWVIRQPVHRGHPRLLFVVTDGAVNNTGKVLELVRNHAFSTRWAQAEGLGPGYPGLPWTGVSRTRATWGKCQKTRKKTFQSFASKVVWLTSKLAFPPPSSGGMRCPHLCIQLPTKALPAA